MVHAIKNGRTSRNEAHASTDIRNKGNTHSLFHAKTNIIDGALERTEEGYNISLPGTKEIIDRYSESEDIVVDLNCEKGWTAVASTCLEGTRVFVGCVPNENVKKEIEDATCNSLIYQVGGDRTTTDMGLDEETKTRMTSVFRDHDFDKHYISAYGLTNGMKLWNHGEGFPVLSDIPTHISNYMTVMTSDMKFTTKKHLKNLSQIGRGCGAELVQTEAEEPLRYTLTLFNLYIDKKYPYTKEGL